MASIVKFHEWNKEQLDPTTPNTDVIDWGVDTIKVALIDNSNAPAEATDKYWSDLEAAEVTEGTEYVAGGKALTSVTITEDTGVTTVDAADVTWDQDASGPQDIYYAVIYKSTGTDSDSLLIGYIDLSGPKSLQSGALTIQWHTDGVFTQT